MSNATFKVLPSEAAAPSENPTPVAMVNMPFASADRPSIQCGLLKASLVKAGHPTRVLYLNLDLAADLGAGFYSELARRREDLLLGDWLFGLAAFGEGTDDKEYLEACPSLATTCEQLGVTFEHLCHLRRTVLPERIRRWADEVDWSAFRVVAFTSMFKQNTAAFALATAIKERHPGVVTVFGGANFDGEMGREWVRGMPSIDYAVTGEGDVTLPEMVSRIGAGQSPIGIPGVVGRVDGEVVGPGKINLVRDMNSLPDPDYDEYFEALFRLGRQRVLGRQPPLLLYESSRGCWWGQRSHCTFCGVNNQGISYRSKSPANAVDQIRRLSQRYKIVNMEAVDNIMDLKYLREFCSPLKENHYDFHLFYEVKSNLKPADLRVMKEAGISVIQPGIESLSTNILRLMHKGVTMLRNVRLLKWAGYYGMRIGWNILTGFPGEKAEDYEQQLQVIRKLRHIPPPHGTGPVWLERFSPFFTDDSFPIRNVRPLDVYRFVYPEDRFELSRVAYFFNYEMDDTLPIEWHQELREEIEAWREAWDRKPVPELIYQRAPDWIQVVDRRNGEVQAHALEGIDAAAYEMCSETERTVDQVVQSLERAGWSGISAARVQERFEDLCDAGVMLTEEGRYLSLAQPANRNW